MLAVIVNTPVSPIVRLSGPEREIVGANGFLKDNK